MVAYRSTTYNHMLFFFMHFLGEIDEDKRNCRRPVMRESTMAELLR